MGKAIQGDIRCSLLALLLTNAGVAVAVENEVDDQVLSALEEEVLWLQEETYVTTATKTLEDIKKSGATVSVLTSEDLKNMGARNLMDGLKRIPGFGINKINIGLPSVEVRGVKTEYSEKVLFLINGHPTNNNLVNGGGTWSFHNFIVDDIKRVEIVRGPGSALYGANAFVAVINIITKRSPDVNGTILSAAGGSGDTKKFNVLTGNRVGDVDFAINLNAYDTDGFGEHVESDSVGASGNTNDWNERYELGINLDYAGLSLHGKYLKRNSGPYVGAVNALNDNSEQQYEEYFVELGYVSSLSSNTSLSSKVYYDHFASDNNWEIYPAGAIPAFPNGMWGRSPITQERIGGEVQAEHILGQHKLLAGVMAEHQSQFDVQFFANFNPVTGAPLGAIEDISNRWNWNGSHNRNISAIYLQDIWDMQENVRLIIGGRYDNYSDFGSSFNPRTSLTWEFVENYNIVAVYGSAFRAPTFGELYNTNNPLIEGNPEVQPEEIDTFELGVNGDVTKRLNFRVTGFRNNIENLIAAAPSASSSAVNVSGNVGKLKVNGIEMELKSRLREGSSVALNYTYQYPVNELTNERAPDVPLHKANASFNYRHSKFFNSYVGVLYRGSTSRAASDPRSDVPDSVTTDIALNWQNYITNLEVTASVYNLFDVQYEDASPSGVMISDFPRDGVSFMLEARYKL
ncbi:TonB-dependent receptor plug domain-containing protein [Alkalimarinus coralli]|uniref:TonB-dependent receptor plug domain-containing protein n=1 Tax=Alkalimarinus coralli TaxID=2935863 RepID=UPI00202B5371|nr:TonB-dependent receptor [Alkalimarinus coralli]